LNTFFLYVLKSKKDGSLYIGQTNNLDDRLAKHNRGEIKSTKSRIPFEIIYSEAFSTRREAMYREKHLKSLSGLKEKKVILAKLGLHLPKFDNKNG